ncbi:MAG: hypothetical protein GF364_07630 [Candidatus Lokiarchaeota archaeon]|nr:hypothetical protein [Candidatus Lokiarchaeota archaeon]
MDGNPKVLKNDHFINVDDKKIDFTRDYLIPFYKKAATIMREYNEDWLLFLENDPSLNGSIHVHQWTDNIPSESIDAFHWYDLIQLGLKKFIYPINLDLMKRRPVLGFKGIQKMYCRQLKSHINMNLDSQTNIPAFLGEFGISMDMDNKKCYRKWAKGNNKENWRNKNNKAFRKHEKILNLMYNCLDTLLLSSTQWNYAPFNDNDYGDHWNLEDLSIYCKDQEVETFEENKYSGARGLAGFCRPYALRIPGKPTRMSFNWRNGEFILEYIPNLSIKTKGEVFIPYVQYPHGYHMRCVGGAFAVRNLADERIYLKNRSNEPVFLIVWRTEALIP